MKVLGSSTLEEISKALKAKAGETTYVLNLAFSVSMTSFQS